ncbi:hypothetical protein jhhlp_000669, partial [Lomentospora prolificans]
SWLTAMPVINGVTTPLEAPEGWVVDFDNPTRQAVPEAFYVSGFGLFFSIAFMAQRMYTKIFLSGGLQVDDYLLIIAFVTAMVAMGLSIHMFASGIGGVHGWEISTDQFAQWTVDVYISAPFYMLCGSFAKLSLLVFYLRLTPQRWFRHLVWAFMAIIGAYTIAIFMPLVFSCRPISKAWDIYMTEGKCINTPILYHATAISNITSDIVLFFLPLPILIKLQIPMQQKIGLFIIFSMASMTVVTSIIRLALLPRLMNPTDPTWEIAYISLWILVEGNLLIMCAALPTFRKFLRHVAPRLIGESTYGKSRTSGHASGRTGTTGPIGHSRYAFGSRLASQSRDPNDGYARFKTNGEAFVMTNVEGGRVKTKGDSGKGVLWNDDDSEKAIVAGSRDIIQTTTIAVEYSTEPEGRRSRNQTP